MKKRIVTSILSAVLTVSLAATAFADTNEEKLAATQSRLNDLVEERAEIEAEISEMNEDLVDLMLRIDETEQDIELTEDEIVETEKEIEVTKEDLKEAEAQRDKQYKDMKLRIQYIYENGGNAGWVAVILESDDVVSVLNKAEYATQIQKADREMFENYIATVYEVEALETQLENQKEALEDARPFGEEPAQPAPAPNPMERREKFFKVFVTREELQALNHFLISNGYTFREIKNQ